MQLPVQISFQNMERSDAIEELVRAKVAKLGEFSDRIMACRVVVETPHRHHVSGNLYNVRVDLTVPGEEIVVKRAAAEHSEYRDINVALRDAFDSARRQLEDHVNRRRGYVKSLQKQPHGRIASLFPEEGFGFIHTPDGREIYFHGNSVLQHGFKKLREGMEVTFAEELGEKGPKATTVQVVGRHGHA